MSLSNITEWTNKNTWFVFFLDYWSVTCHIAISSDPSYSELTWAFQQESFKGAWPSCEQITGPLEDGRDYPLLSTMMSLEDALSEHPSLGVLMSLQNLNRFITKAGYHLRPVTVL